MADLTVQELADAMRRAWDEFCTDTGCIPSDFTVHGPGTTRVVADFGRGEFARMVFDELDRPVIESQPAQPRQQCIDRYVAPIVAERDAAREELADSSRERNVYAERWRQNGKALLQRRSELDLALWLHAEAAWQRDVLSTLLRGMARRSVRLKRQRYYWRRTLKAIHAATGAEKGVSAVVAVEWLRSRVADLESQLARAVMLPEDRSQAWMALWNAMNRHPKVCGAVSEERLDDCAWAALEQVESWRGGTAEEERDG